MMQIAFRISASPRTMGIAALVVVVLAALI
jgi:hypothetical protein